ncbi:hypothetical protein QQS21_009857 [Conoideocrella luteorostrata]|uniref:Copper acquisition factor BIM1-like domain-containing protein n=1 Tax=Conoideocrella luteorostrata TaxID=1105319 RepID=A0AAJ0CG91_9HYPO|nr:hypothetical protein QQS21_009857 [Conoideocrella luteorostrata]
MLLAIIALAFAALTAGHSVISYPGWRGNSLIQNETFPYGMQWMYPCGGIGTTKNRTYWPTTGGALAFQPGWFRGHSLAVIYVNLGFGIDGPDHGPENMSFPMVHPFTIQGPTNNPYPGTICLPQVPLPANTTVKAGDLATIQVVELAQHGAALYSCVDIIFADPGDSKIGLVNETNCFNSTDIGFAEMYTIATKDSGTDAYIKSAAESLRAMTWMGYLPILVAGLLTAL